MTAKETPEQLLERLTVFIETTRDHVAEGGEADLEGLDGKIQELCDAVLDMPKAEALIFQEKLVFLVAQLTALKDNLEAVQDDIRQQLSSLDLRHKAVKAYKNTEAAESNQPPKNKP